MIAEGRMNGQIDQVEEIVHFGEPNAEQMWNDQIKHTCNQDQFKLLYITSILGGHRKSFFNNPKLLI